VWSGVSASYDVFSALWSEQFDFGLGVGLKLKHNPNWIGLTDRTA